MFRTAEPNDRLRSVALSVAGLLFALVMPESFLLAADADSGNEATSIQVVTASAHGRSIVGLRGQTQLNFVLYAKGTLTVEESGPGSDGEWTGSITHVSGNGGTQRYGVEFQAASPAVVVLNGRSISIPAVRSQQPEDSPRAPWLVLTSFGRAVTTGRYFDWPETLDLDRSKKYSHAWYFDNDLHEAEVYRNSLEMRDVRGWSISWDQQHCIQHSDNGRVARLRIYADGRIVANRSRNEPLTESQVAPADVQQLIDDLRAMGREQTKNETAAVSISAEAAELVTARFPRELGQGLWDQHQELLVIRDGDNESLIRVVYPGPDGRPSSVPAGWAEMRDRLWGFLNAEGTTGRQGND